MAPTLSAAPTLLRPTIETIPEAMTSPTTTTVTRPKILTSKPVGEARGLGRRDWKKATGPQMKAMNPATRIITAGARKKKDSKLAAPYCNLAKKRTQAPSPNPYQRRQKVQPSSKAPYKDSYYKAHPHDDAGVLPLGTLDNLHHIDGDGCYSNSYQRSQGNLGVEGPVVRYLRRRANFLCHL